jgi:hypothetical protein
MRVDHVVFCLPSEPVREADSFAPAWMEVQPYYKRKAHGRNWAAMSNWRSVSLPIGSLSLHPCMRSPILIHARLETSRTTALEDAVGDLTSFATVLIDALVSLSRILNLFSRELSLATNAKLFLAPYLGFDLLSRSASRSPQIERSTRLYFLPIFPSEVDSLLVFSIGSGSTDWGGRNHPDLHPSSFGVLFLPKLTG